MYAGDNNPNEHSTPSDQAVHAALVTACKLVKAPHELKYASDLNTLESVKAGTILVYILDLGSSGPPFQKIGGEKVYYNAFNLYIVNDANPSAKLRSTSSAADHVDGVYRSSGGKFFEIKWRASVTFDGENGPGGYLEGQGGLLSTAEYDDIISYLQTQPFRLTKEWKDILSGGHLSACNIKWTATDRYMSSQTR